MLVSCTIQSLTHNTNWVGLRSNGIRHIKIGLKQPLKWWSAFDIYSYSVFWSCWKMEKYHQRANASMSPTVAHMGISAEPIQRLGSSYRIDDLMVHPNVSCCAWSVKEEYQAYVMEYQDDGIIAILPYWKVSMAISHLSRPTHRNWC